MKFIQSQSTELAGRLSQGHPDVTARKEQSRQIEKFPTEEQEEDPNGPGFKKKCIFRPDKADRQEAHGFESSSPGKGAQQEESVQGRGKERVGDSQGRSKSSQEEYKEGSATRREEATCRKEGGGKESSAEARGEESHIN